MKVPSKLFYFFARIVFPTFLTQIFLMLPDVLFGAMHPRFGVCVNMDKLLTITLLSLLLTMIKNMKVIVCFLTVFGTMQIIQFCNMDYFGTYLTAYALEFVFLETQDIWTEAKSVWTDYLYIIPLVAVPYGILGVLYSLQPSGRVTFKYTPLLLMVFFGYFFYKAATPEGAFQMLFKNTCYASYNTINSYSAFFASVLPSRVWEEEPQKSFPPYKITRTKGKKGESVNVILVIGESVNARNMSLFGYHRQTTPFLKTYAAENPGFVYKKAWGAAVNTLISLPMIYNIQVNPKNSMKLAMQDTSLLKLAKANGFKVTYIELQNPEVFRKTGQTHYDILHCYDEEKEKEFGGERGYLEHVLKQTSLSGRNFIIVHKRNVHSPYSSNYKYEEGRYDIFPEEQGKEPSLEGKTKGAGKEIVSLDEADQERIDSYDNAMAYEDDLLKILLEFAGSSNQKTYFFYTSDHGESLGENGLWGHGHLDASDLEVPFFYQVFLPEEKLFDAQGLKKEKSFIEKIRKMPIICAHHISLMTAQKLGYIIEVPGEDLSVCQINGRDSMGRAGILKVFLDKKGKIKFEKEL